MDDKKKILVTGGAGFIGSHLVERLVNDGNDVTVFDDLSTGDITNLKSVWTNVRLYMWLPDLSDYDVIYHLAGNASIPLSIDNPEMDFHANITTTFNLLERLRQCDSPPLLINVSSAAVYGNPLRLPIREFNQTVPISPYGVSKLASECYVSVYHDLFDLPVATVRLFSVYGPRQEKQVIYDFFSKLKQNPKELQVLGDGSQMRDFTWVGDAVAALELVANKADAKGEVYNVASGVSFSIDHLAKACAEIVGASPEIIYSGETRPGDARKWVVSIWKMRNLGYRPKTILKDGLFYTWNWYKNSD